MTQAIAHFKRLPELLTKSRKQQLYESKDAVQSIIGKKCLTFCFDVEFDKFHCLRVLGSEPVLALRTRNGIYPSDELFVICEVKSFILTKNMGICDMIWLIFKLKL